MSVRRFSDHAFMVIIRPSSSHITARHVAILMTWPSSFIIVVIVIIPIMQALAALLKNTKYSQLSKAVGLLKEWQRSLKMLQGQWLSPVFDAEAVGLLSSTIQSGEDCIQTTYAAFQLAVKIPAITIIAHRKQTARALGEKVLGSYGPTARMAKEVKKAWGSSLYDRYEQLLAGTRFEPLDVGS
eukprot:5870309-Karenia_brevis.AAC.1